MFRNAMYTPTMPQAAAQRSDASVNTPSKAKGFWKGKLIGAALSGAGGTATDTSLENAAVSTPDAVEGISNAITPDFQSIDMPPAQMAGVPQQANQQFLQNATPQFQQQGLLGMGQQPQQPQGGLMGNQSLEQRGQGYADGFMNMFGGW